MTYTTKQKHSFFQWAVAIAFFVTAGISAVTLPWPKKETAVGYYKVSSNPFGTAIYQDGLHKSIQCVSCTVTSQTGRTIVFSTIKHPLTLVYGRDDIIWDDLGNLYTEPKEAVQKRIEQAIGMSMTKLVNLNRTVPVLSPNLTVLNPNNPGLLKLTVPTGSSVTINRETKTIEIKGTAVKIKVLETL